MSWTTLARHNGRDPDRRLSWTDSEAVEDSEHRLAGRVPVRRFSFRGASETLGGWVGRWVDLVGW